VVVYGAVMGRGREQFSHNHMFHDLQDTCLLTNCETSAHTNAHTFCMRYLLHLYF
jgi:hypothetical protein